MRTIDFPLEPVFADNANAFGLLNELVSFGVPIRFDLSSLLNKKVNLLVLFRSPDGSSNRQIREATSMLDYGEVINRINDLNLDIRVGVTERGQVFIEMPPLPEGVGIPRLYRSLSGGKWELPAQNGTPVQIEAIITRSGVYHIFTQALNLPFIFGEVYVYPNPVTGRDGATLHIEVGKAESLGVRLYDVAGELVNEFYIENKPDVIDKKVVYEVPLDLSKFESGVYLGVVTAKKSGKQDVRKKFRFSVLK